MMKMLLLSSALLLCFSGLFAQNNQQHVVLFDTDEAVLSAKAQTQLDNLANELTSCANCAVTITGHTDDRASDSYNTALARKRAEAVKAYLVDANIAAMRMQVLVKGESEPGAPNNSDENRALNRRVELVIHYPKSPHLMPAPGNEVQAIGVAAGGQEMDGADTAENTISEKSTTETLDNGTIVDWGSAPAGALNVAIIDDVSAMEKWGLTTMAVDGTPMISNRMICFSAGDSTGPCELNKPMILRVPLNNNRRYCLPSNGAFYSSVRADTSAPAYWIPSTRKLELVYEGSSAYLKITLTNACSAVDECINLDCTGMSPDSLVVTIKGRRLIIGRASIIYPQANAWLEGSELAPGSHVWKMPLLSYPITEAPKLQLIAVDKHDQKYLAKMSTTQLKLHRRAKMYRVKRKSFRKIATPTND